MRLQTHEITKASDGSMLVVTWEWRNGWNLVTSRKATIEEVQQFEKGDGLPVKI